MTKTNINTVYVNYDGKNTEGVGAMVQLQLHGYAYSRIKNCNFYFPGFINLSHFQNTDQTQEIFVSNINKFYNLPSSKSQNIELIDSRFLLKTWGEQNIKSKRKYIEELSNRITYNGEFYFNKDKLSVVIHIRVLNSQDTCNANSREYFDFTEQKKNYYTNIIDNLQNIHGNDLDIHIFSQGNKNDFLFISEKFKVNLHINDDLLSTIYHMIYADILVTANSSLSYSSHLYGQNKYVYSRKTFSHSWYDGTKFLNENGQII